MAEALSAVVVGAGWAGEGHTRALRHHGVEVVAICARREEAARALALRLGVAGASGDWRRTLREVRPGIVGIATPAAVRGDVVAEAVAHGSDIFCDKPLALSAEDAAGMYQAVHAAGVHHAYAATYQYDPSVAWMAEMVREGRIGRLQALDLSMRSALGTGIAPWSWNLNPAEGGGVLNNGFTHALGTLARICGGPALRVTGDTVMRAVRAPVVPGLADFRAWQSTRLTPQEAQGLEWREGAIERRYRALLVFACGELEVPATVTWDAGPAAPWPANGLRLLGDEGTIVAVDRGYGVYDVGLVRPGAEVAAPLSVPARLAATDPDAADPVQSRWNALARDFVADIRGEAHAPYPTFLDGWRQQVAIDTVRGSGGWVTLP